MTVSWERCGPLNMLSLLRYIRSERSVILINFCLSIISSNALILIGQTQTRNKVRANEQAVSYHVLSQGLVKILYSHLSISSLFPLSTPLTLSFFLRLFFSFSLTLCPSLPILCSLPLSGDLHAGRCFPAFLLPVVVLLGSDRGVAVIHGRHWPA